MADFDSAFKKVLTFEGGYKLHQVPGDHGGMTYAGIARNAWPDWPGWKLIDAGETTGARVEEKVRSFYKTHFWDVILGDQIGFQGIAFIIYDFAVNAGVKTAVKIVQHIVGATPDGIFGPKTFSKLNAYVTDAQAERLFCAEFSIAKVFRYKDICMADRRRRNDKVGSNLKFLCGWINRVQKGML